MEILRRLLPILLLAALVLPPFAPMLASWQSGDAGLPACCRRGGRHHCAMSMAEGNLRVASDVGDGWEAPRERCPFCPAAVISGHRHETLAGPPLQAFFEPGYSHPSGAVQTECKRRISLDRSRQKRGPPTLLS